jgi:methane/ammonia monooxygenase subunit B
MKLLKLFVFSSICLSGLFLSTSTAWAHGERSLEPFVRMRTVQWYDVNWSASTVAVNDELTITGKVHVAEDWPNSLPKPEAAYLGVIAPGPVFLRKERWINGEAHLNSLPLKVGRDYEFKMKLKARIPGRYHIHPSFNIIDTGNVAGPGQWVEITGNANAFTNNVETVKGEMINLETYGTANGVRWHMLWMILGIAWLVWWVRRPLFIPRYAMVNKGEEDKLVTPKDKNLAKAILVAVPVIVLSGYFVTNSQYPETIPLQASLDLIPPLPEQADLVNAKIKRATYNIPQRSMMMMVEIKNDSQKTLQIGEFTTRSVRFINSNMKIDASHTPPEYLATNGMQIEPNDLIHPGEAKVVKIMASDAVWEIEHLSSVIGDADSRFGGLLFLFDDQGNRYLSSISASLIPEYK